MHDIQVDDPFAARLRQDAEALPGPDAAWSARLSAALEREPAPRPVATSASPWALAAALLVSIGLTLGLVDTSRSAGETTVAETPTGSQSTAQVPELPLSLRLSVLISTTFRPQLRIEDPLQVELAALQRDAEAMATAMLDRARGPLRPFLGDSFAQLDR